MKTPTKQRTSKKANQDQIQKHRRYQLPSGRYAEQEAQKLLVREGYEILASNFYCGFGEIDLIAYKTGLLLFVEVKARTSSKYGHPHEFVTIRKQNKILKTAKYYLSQNPFPQDIENINYRFDVISIMLSNGETEWYSNAFSGEGFNV